MTFPLLLCPFCSHIPVKQLLHSLPILFLQSGIHWSVLSGWRGTSLYSIGIPDGITVHFLAAERFEGERQLNGYDFLSFSVPPSSRSLRILNFEGTRGTSLNISVFNKNRLCWPGYRHTSQLPDIVLAPLLSSSAKQWQTHRKKRQKKTDQTEQDHLVKINADQGGESMPCWCPETWIHRCIDFNTSPLRLQWFWCSLRDTMRHPARWWMIIGYRCHSSF